MAAGSGGWILSDGVPEREKNSAAFFYRLLEHAPPSRLGESDKLEQHRLSLSLSLSLFLSIYISLTHTSFLTRSHWLLYCKALREMRKRERTVTVSSNWRSTESQNSETPKLHL